MHKKISNFISTLNSSRFVYQEKAKIWRAGSKDMSKQSDILWSKMETGHILSKHLVETALYPRNSALILSIIRLFIYPG